jgi:hypothetical protein
MRGGLRSAVSIPDFGTVGDLIPAAEDARVRVIGEGADDEFVAPHLVRGR